MKRCWSWPRKTEILWCLPAIPAALQRWDRSPIISGTIVEVGIAEQNIVGLSAGLAHSGKKPFVTSPACFLSNLIYDHGSWLSKSLKPIQDVGIHLSKLKHGNNEPDFRANVKAFHLMGIR